MEAFFIFPFLFLQCDNNDLEETDDSTRKSGPERVHLKILHPSFFSAHGGEDTTKKRPRGEFCTSLSPTRFRLFYYPDNECDERHEHRKESGQHRIELETTRARIVLTAMECGTEQPFLTVIKRHISTRRLR